MTSAWHDRLLQSFGPEGYKPFMRRSLQTCILFETRRIVQPLLGDLKPFQRKFAFMAMANDLLQAMDFISPDDKVHIMYRTMSSNELLPPDVAYKRAQMTERELQRLGSLVMQYHQPARPHHVACNLMVQQMYLDAMKKEMTEPTNPQWEHTHNHCMMIFRMYYNYDAIDPHFPSPLVVKKEELKYPLKKPDANMFGGPAYAMAVGAPPDVAAAAAPPLAGEGAARLTSPNRKHRATQHHQRSQLPFTGGSVRDMGASHDDSHIDVDALLDPVEERRKVLAEVKEHLDLLKEFEGAISEEEIVERKRQLFLALPAAPPASKTMRLV